MGIEVPKFTFIKKILSFVQAIKTVMNDEEPNGKSTEEPNRKSTEEPDGEMPQWNEEPNGEIPQWDEKHSDDEAEAEKEHFFSPEEVLNYVLEKRNFEQRKKAS